jgi:hypothetical protein
MYRRAIPMALAQGIPAFGRQRVLTAIAAELTSRTPAELAERIRRRWEPWQWRDDIDDPTAVAITIVRRGYPCPDLRCEQHHRLDTGQACAACTQIAGETARHRTGAPDHGQHPDAISARPSGPAPIREVLAAARSSQPSLPSTATTTNPAIPPSANATYRAARTAVDALHRRNQQRPFAQSTETNPT